MKHYTDSLKLIPTEIYVTPTYFCITVDSLEQALQVNQELSNMGLTDLTTSFCPIGKDYTVSYGQI